MPNALVIGAGPVGLVTAMLLGDRGLDLAVANSDPAPPDTVEDA